MAIPKRHIMVVDSDPYILDVIGIILEDNGYDVIPAANGREALDLFCEAPDLILLDLLMPLPDGVEVCKKLKQNPKTRHIPVILFSTHLDIEDISRSLHADDWLQKPFEVDQLLGKIADNLVRVDHDNIASRRYTRLKDEY